VRQMVVLDDIRQAGYPGLSGLSPQRELSLADLPRRAGSR
jgi:hypothetical protein